MTSDMTPTERLSRHRNDTLQRQLQITLQILDKEKRGVKDEVEKVIRQYHHFLVDISNRWTGLDDYQQPDTRAMKRNSPTKDRQTSMSLEDAAVQDSPSHSTTSARKTTRRSPETSPVMTRRHSNDYKHPKFTTCIEVLDDIIQNHHTRKNAVRLRKIGLVLPTDNRPKTVHTAVTTKEENSSRAEDHRTCIRLRPASSYIRTPEKLRSSTDVYERPQTAQPLLSSHRDMAERHPTPSNNYRRRPKTTPLKYELYGRSPAVSRQTVAGIMAEVNSRCAATRKMLGRSKQLHDYIVSLG